MSYDEYLLAFESILYGLMVSRIIVEWNKILQNSESYGHYWAYYLFTFTVFLIIVHVYLQNWDRERYDMMNRSAAFLLLGVLPPTIFSFISYQLFPHKTDVDLKVFLMESKMKILVPAFIFYSFFTAFMIFRYGWHTSNILAVVIQLFGFGVLFNKKYWVFEVYIVLLFVFTLWLYLGYYLVSV